LNLFDSAHSAILFAARKMIIKITKQFIVEVDEKLKDESFIFERSQR